MSPEIGSANLLANLLQLSPAARYALRGMVYLARQPANVWVLTSAAAAAQNLPKNFLSKIFQRLCRQGLLLARRGPGGGYCLARLPTQVSLAAIVDAVEPVAVNSRQCLLDSRPCGEAAEHCVLHEARYHSDESFRAELVRLTLKDLADSRK